MKFFNLKSLVYLLCAVYKWYHYVPRDEPYKIEKLHFSLQNCMKFIDFIDKMYLIFTHVQNRSHEFNEQLGVRILWIRSCLGVFTYPKYIAFPSVQSINFAILNSRSGEFIRLYHDLLILCFVRKGTKNFFNEPWNDTFCPFNAFLKTAFSFLWDFHCF